VERKRKSELRKETQCKIEELTKGGRCLKAFTGFHNGDSPGASASVCSLLVSSVAPDSVKGAYFGVMKQTSTIRARPASIRVSPKMACTYEHAG
jgi:hypothetical protein